MRPRVRVSPGGAGTRADARTAGILAVLTAIAHEAVKDLGLPSRGHEFLVVMLVAALVLWTLERARRA